MNGIETVTTFDTVYNADTVEWCPVSPFRNLLVCGTYQLNEATKDRFGRLYLLKVSTSSLHVVQQLDIAAIPDCKWCPISVSGKILLAVATTAGQIIVYELKTADCDESVQLVLLCETNLKRESELLALSVSWYANDCSDDPLLSASDSCGCVTVLQLTSISLSIKHNWKAHSYETWTATFNVFNPSIVYTGGDDSVLTVYDTKAGIHVARITSAHDSGVTSLLSSPKSSNLFLSGSYDENVRFWDSKYLKSPVEVVNVGGGVWRLKLQPHSNSLLLTACMNGGTKIVDTEDKGVVSEYYGHNSIVYGADWCHFSSYDISGQCPDLVHKHYSCLIATCSFYDHRLCLSGFYVKQ